MSIMGGGNKIVEKIKKLSKAPQPEIFANELWLTFWGSLLGIGSTAWLAFFWNCPMLLGGYGATALLIYGAYETPMAQPRNVLLGHVLAACIGMVVYDFFGTTWWSLALGVALALVLMMATYSMHPPAGATAYVAIQTGGLGVGYMYILNPVFLGVFVLLLIAIIFNKLSKRPYPTHWW